LIILPILHCRGIDMRRKLLKIFLITVVVTIGIAVGSTLGVALLSSWLGSRTGESTTQRKVTPKVPSYSREELLNETNKHREQPLTLDPVLNDSAQRKCEDTAVKDIFEHGNPRDYIPADRAYSGENLAYGQSSERQVVDEWVASPSHNENLVRSEYKRMGFGLCPFRGGILVVQHFSD
jgi:uncharacterized protein YkwD